MIADCSRRLAVDETSQDPLVVPQLKVGHGHLNSAAEDWTTQVSRLLRGGRTQAESPVGADKNLGHSREELIVSFALKSLLHRLLQSRVNGLPQHQWLAGEGCSTEALKRGRRSA